MMNLKEDYFKALKKRAKTSRVYKKYQLVGLEIAQVLEDEKHKSLYIKLAKEHNPDALRALAQEVAERTQVKKKGAYFMKLLALQKQEGGKTQKESGR